TRTAERDPQGRLSACGSSASVDPTQSSLVGATVLMRNSALEFVESTQRRKDVADFRTGDTVRVNWKVKEGDKEREQAFEGVVIRKKRGGVSASFTVRKVSYGVGVERIFPLHSPRYP